MSCVVSFTSLFPYTEFPDLISGVSALNTYCLCARLHHCHHHGKNYSLWSATFARSGVDCCSHGKPGVYLSQDKPSKGAAQAGAVLVLVWQSSGYTLYLREVVKRNPDPHVRFWGFLFYR